MLGRMNSTKATMTRQAVGIRSEMHALRVSLAKQADRRTAGWRMLGRSLDRLMELWDKYDDLYESLVGFAQEVESVTDQQRQADKEAHQTFQSDVLTLRDEVQEVVDAGYAASEALKHEQTKDKKIKQMGEKFEAAYNGIDAALAEMKTSLADENTRYSLDLLKYKSGRLELIGNQIAAADGIAEALFELDLEQDTVTADNKEKRKSDMEIVLGQCETMIHSKRAAIQEKLDVE